MNWRDAADAALEAPVVTSFTRIGHDLRQRIDRWEDPATDLSGRTVVLTGATSGLGRSAAGTLASAGATVVIVGRDERRTAEARDQLIAGAESAGPGTARADVRVAIADMGDLEAVRRLGDELVDEHPVIDALVHNAGALSHERIESPQGIEQTVASQVVGPFLLTSMLLAPLAAAAPGRVVTMASGGMYAAPLSVGSLQMGEDDYDGTQQYARAKRAQVTLNEMWAERLDPNDVVVHALHPGWADTPGVRDSLPTFRRVLGPLLRTPDQGADTLVWLVSSDEATRSSGGFWLDRRQRSIHKLPTTRRSDTPERRDALWALCEDLSGSGPQRP